MITLLTHPHLYSTKIISETEVIGYSKQKTFSVDTVELSSFPDLAELLIMLRDQPYTFAIRGEPISDAQKVNRLKDVFFEEHSSGRNWIMIDFDKKVRPDWIPAGDLYHQHQYLLSLLPNIFWNVSHYWHWSSSAGLDGWRTLSGHAWFWLSEPKTDTYLQRWAKAHKVDPAPFRTVQPNYTADPVFIDVDDHLDWNERGFIFVGDIDEVQLDWQMPPEPVYVPRVSTAFHVPYGNFMNLLEEVGKEHVNTPVYACICSWIATTGPCSDYEVMKGLLRAQLARSARSGERLSDEYFREQIKAANKKVSHLSSGPSIPLNVQNSL